MLLNPQPKCQRDQRNDRELQLDYLEYLKQLPTKVNVSALQICDSDDADYIAQRKKIADNFILQVRPPQPVPIIANMQFPNQHVPPKNSSQTKLRHALLTKKPKGMRFLWEVHARMVWMTFIFFKNLLY